MPPIRWVCAHGRGAYAAALAVVLLTLSVISAAWADDYQSHEDIRAAVKAFLRSQLPAATSNHRIQVGNLDRRLKLAACAQPLETFAPPGGRTVGNTAVGVRCPAPKPWKIYVTATVKALQPVVVAARALPRETPLSEGDIKMAERDITRLSRGYLNETENAIGKRLQRSLRPGAVVSPSALRAALLVERGQQVTLIAKSAGIAVRSQGTALMDGTAGDVIRVRNEYSKRIVEGTVSKPGTVEVPM